MPGGGTRVTPYHSRQSTSLSDSEYTDSTSDSAEHPSSARKTAQHQHRLETSWTDDESDEGWSDDSGELSEEILEKQPSQREKPLYGLNSSQKSLDPRTHYMAATATGAGGLNDSFGYLEPSEALPRPPTPPPLIPFAHSNSATAAISTRGTPESAAAIDNAVRQDMESVSLAISSTNCDDTVDYFEDEYASSIIGKTIGKSTLSTASLDYDEKSEQEQSPQCNRCIKIGLTVSLGCLLISLAAFGGGLLGIFLTKNNTPMPTMLPTAMPTTGAPSRIPTVPPTAPPTALSSAPSTAPSTTPSTAHSETPSTTPSTTPSATNSTTPSPTYPLTPNSTDLENGNNSTTEKNTPTASPTTTAPTNTYVPEDGALFSSIAAKSFDSGAAIETFGTPQNRAFVWLQDDVQAQDERQLRKARRNLKEISTFEKTIQRYAMAVFYYSTNGDDWTNNTNWLSFNTSECLWANQISKNEIQRGSACDGDNRLTILDFEANNLQGTLPAELGLLKHLTHFRIVHLQKKETFGLNGGGSSGFTGLIPKELGLATNMRVVELFGNDFTDTLHGHLFSQWTQLETLNFANSGLTGELPAAIGKLTNATQIVLGSNDFSGSVPYSIGLLTSLRYLDLSNNQLDGTLAPEIGSLVNLEALIVNGNLFFGEIPDSLSTLIKLKKIRFDNNNFSGIIPESFCKQPVLLYGDCKEIECPCCTFCCTNNGTADGCVQQ